MLRLDLKNPTKPTILEDVQQAPNEELKSFLKSPRREILDSTPCGDETADVRQSLLAAIQDQHDQLHAQIEGNRKALMDHIDRLTRPCQQVPSDSVKGRTPPDTCCTAKAATQPDLVEVPDSTQISQSAKLAGRRTLASLPGDVGCAVAASTGLRTGPNEGNDSIPRGSDYSIPRGSDLFEIMRTKGQSMERTFCGQFESRFDFAVCMLIVLNIAVITVQLQWEGHKASVSLGFSEDSGWDGVMWWFDRLEHVFAILFFLELLVRIRALRLKYFAKAANLFDVFLVASSIAELYILTPLGRASGKKLSMLRVVRLCKIARVMRALRVMKLFWSLHIIGSAIFHSMSSLFWSVVVMFMIVLMGGLFMSHNLAEYVMDEEKPLSTRSWVYEYYGGSARATLTMFEITMSGCWPNYSRRLIEEVSVWYVLFFIFYIAGVIFGVTRIITAVVLRDTLQAAETESDRMIIEMKHHRRALMHQLQEFFFEADQSSDGMVDRYEFEQMLQNPNVRLWLKSMGLAVDEYVALFHVIDNGSGAISFQEFLDGVNRLKGNARSVDIFSISLELGRIRQSISELEKGLHKVDGEADA